MDQEILGDVLPIGRESSLDLSVVCPFYNEEGIIGDAIRALLAQLETLDLSWELVVVNDGSVDRSPEIAAELARESPNLRLLGYGFNRGRGFALRTGIAQARGEIIVTTEIDLSWGEEIVQRLLQSVHDNPDADIVVASPHLPGGGYRNVPSRRVFFSKFGNWVIRACMSNAASMNTGMTRAYRRDSILSLPLEEDGKEFHLEVILKAHALNYSICEIPALLEWKEYKHKGGRVQRKSSSKVNKLVITHSLFSLFANPIRYTWGLGALSVVISGGFLMAGVVRYGLGLVSVYMLIISLVFAIIALLLFAFGVIAQQGNMVQRELWTLKRDMWLMRQGANPRGLGSATGAQQRAEYGDHAT